MSNIVVNTTSNSAQTGIVIVDQTDWASLGVSRSILTSMRIDLYGAFLVTPVSLYTLDAPELASFVDTGTVELSFLKLYGSLYVADGWWTIQTSSNMDTYISNYSEFGVYASISFAVASQINSLHVPENIKYNAEKYCIMAMWLDYLKYLDTTNVNSRRQKFISRLISLQKMMLNI